MSRDTIDTAGDPARIAKRASAEHASHIRIDATRQAHDALDDARRPLQAYRYHDRASRASN